MSGFRRTTQVVVGEARYSHISAHQKRKAQVSAGEWE
jgi:hypothetical protein